MRGVLVLRREPRVETIFGKVLCVRNIKAEAAEARRADQDEQGLIALDAASEIVEACTNQLRAGERVRDLHPLSLARGAQASSPAVVGRLGRWRSCARARRART